MTPVRNACILIAVLFAGFFSATSVASAHASLISTSPTTGSHVDEAPSELIMQLNEPVTLIEGSAQLIDSDGGVAELAEARVDDGGRRIVLVPAGGVGDGAYLATARVVSADTHVVSLSIQFAVGAVTEQGDFAQSGAESAEQYVNSPSKVVSYLGLVLSSGLLLASLWVWRAAPNDSRFRNVYRVGAGLLILGLAGRSTVLVAQQSGGIGRMTGATAADVLFTPHGIAISAAVVLSAASIVLPPGQSRVRVVVPGLQAIAAILAVTLGGHGGSAQGWPWAFLGTLVHVYGITVWLGGLAVILLVLRGVPQQRRRWHIVAASHVGLVLLGGVVVSVLQVHPIGALWGTTYGLVLLAKVFGASIVVGLGYAAYRGCRVAIGPEAVVAIVVLVLTSVLSTMVPAKDVYTTDVETSLDFGSSEVLDIAIDSIRRGPQVLTITAAGADASASVSVDFSSAAANVARLPVELTTAAEQDGSAVWRSDGLVVPAPGEWKVTVRFDGSHGPKVASFFYETL